MATATRTERAPAPPTRGVSPRIDRALGHPTAFLATAALLLALFGWTFVENPDRVAPTKDPAYYTWRTEVLLAEEPSRLLEIEGAFDMFSAGYRVSAPVLGGVLRRLPGVASLTTTSFLMVAIPVLTALLLGGFAYRQRRDAVIFHAVALGAAGLFFTPPFVGYLDNILSLFWLAASLYFLAPARTSWAARAALGTFLVLAGLTHTTTLAIFGLTLGAFAAVRLIARRFDLRSVIRDDGPMLATALGAAVFTYLIWRVGIWGKSASLTEAALPPPYGSDFFRARMGDWVDAMRPAFNGPLLAIGAVGLLAAGRRAAEDDLARVSIVWLAPLAGLFGFVAGLTYPYYRFFNTTLSWVLLVGLGAYFVTRFFIDRAGAGGVATLALLGVVGVAVILGTNFTKGYEITHWNDTSKGWLSADERRDLDALRAELVAQDVGDRPVVFVFDNEPDRPFQIWGDTKLTGNTSRYGLPQEEVDQAHLYLGSLDNFLAGEPTVRGEETYDKLSPALLEETEAATAGANTEPLVVVAAVFNTSGANAELAAADSPPETGDTEVWIVHDGAVITGDEVTAVEPQESAAGAAHLLRVLGALLLLLVPGVIAYRRVVPGGGLAEALGMVPALSLGLLALSGTLVLAVARTPFTGVVAWVTLLVAIAGAVALRLLPEEGTARQPALR